MRTADQFYPGFELAGLETRLDRWLTSLVCGVVLMVVGAHYHLRRFRRWLDPYPKPEPAS